VIGSLGSSADHGRVGRRLGQLLAGTLVKFEHALFIANRASVRNGRSQTGRLSEFRTKQVWVAIVLIAPMPDLTLIEDPPATIGTLKGLLDLTRTADKAPLRRVLEAAGEAIAMSAGFRVVCMNVYRPEYDDYKAMFVHGRDELPSPELSAPSIPRDFLAELPGTPVERAPGIYFVSGTPGMWDGHPNFVPSTTREAAGPDAWRNEDLLLMLLEDVDGEPLGLLSIDEPISGLRPTDGDLRMLRVICLHVEQALRTAKRARENEQDKRMLARLSEISPEMSECSNRRELYRLVGETIAPDLGFERVAVYAMANDGGLRRVDLRGWESFELLPERLPEQHLSDLLSPDQDRAGVWLLPARRVFEGWVGPRSRRNGRGPLAWRDHCLLVPWTNDHSMLAGVVIAEDPVDQLLPRQQHRHTLRRLVDLAASIEHTIGQRARLDRLASFDTLTGLRNRRGLDELIDENPDCALMVCDLDDFKQINDRYGHETGDLVLARFAEILREHTREADTAIRLGGDEFCVILAGTDYDGARLVAERIRATTPFSMRGLVPATVTASVGLTRRVDGEPNPRTLLDAADRALYGAKHEGRNRTVISPPCVAQ
jgi:diguanylate cyclase (GGDEF)-like protein